MGLTAHLLTLMRPYNPMAMREACTQPPVIATNPANNHPPQVNLSGADSRHSAEAGRRLSTLSAGHRVGSRRAAVSQPPESNAGTLREVALAEFRIAGAVGSVARVCPRRADRTGPNPTIPRAAANREQLRLLALRGRAGMQACHSVLDWACSIRT
jgi:hypothetical protein